MTEDIITKLKTVRIIDLIINVLLFLSFFGPFVSIGVGIVERNVSGFKVIEYGFKSLKNLDAPGIGDILGIFLITHPLAAIIQVVVALISLISDGQKDYQIIIKQKSFSQNRKIFGIVALVVCSVFYALIPLLSVKISGYSDNEFASLGFFAVSASILTICSFVFLTAAFYNISNQLSNDSNEETFQEPIEEEYYHESYQGDFSGTIDRLKAMEDSNKAISDHNIPGGDTSFRNQMTGNYKLRFSLTDSNGQKLYTESVFSGSFNDAVNYANSLKEQNNLELQSIEKIG